MAERSIAYRFVGKFNNLTSGLAAAGRQVDEFGNRLSKLDRDGRKARQALDTVGQTAGRVGLVVGGSLALAAKAAMDWETAWTGVLKTVNGSDAEIAQLEKDLRGLTEVLPASHTEIAAVAEAAGQLGVETPNIVEFTKTMVMLGETTNLTAEGAATAIAQMANVMQTAPEDIDNVGAALVALGNAGASTEAEILDMAQRIAGAGAQIGLTESDILAIANAASSMGINAEAGGSALARVFTELAKATKQGGDAVSGFADVAGMSVADFTAAFEKDPARAFDSFVRGLDRINKSGGDVFTTLDGLGLSDIRVSQALLSMAAAGDLTTKSLDLGAQAFEQNSALAEEFGKRASTTASQVQLMFNQVKNGAIDVGNAALPIIAYAAETVGDLAAAFSDLPGPVKGFVTAGAGVVALFGGGLWFTSKVVGGISSMNAALADLGVTTRVSGRGLAMMAAKTTAAVTAIALLDDAFDKINGADIDSSKLSRSLDAFADGRMTNEVEKLGDAFRTLRIGPSTNVVENAADLLGIADSGFTEAKRNIEQIDDALASLVEAGDADKAGMLFEKFSKMAKDAGLTTKQTAEAFDQYKLALKNTEPSTGKATDAAKAHTEVVKQQADALAEAQDEARKIAGEFVNLGDSVDDSKVSLGSWLAELEKQGQALRDFTANAKTAARKGLREGLIAELEAAGPAGALRMKQLADGTQSEIRRANKAFDTNMAAMAAWEAYRLSAKDLKVNVDPAIAAAMRLQAVIDGLHGNTVAINVVKTYRNVISGEYDYYGNKINPADGGTIPLGGGRARRAAMGSTVPKDGLPYGDRYPYLLAPGEEVISNRHGQADRHRGLLKAINENRLADGGTVAMAANRAREFGSALPSSGAAGGTVVHRHVVEVRGEMDLAHAKAQIVQIAHDVSTQNDHEHDAWKKKRGL